MSDQCKHCLVRGDYEGCLKTPCFHHENWINIQRIKKIKHLESLKKIEWKPIETAPKNEKYILCYHILYKIPIAVKYVEKGTLSFILESSWIEKTRCNYWPEQAFSHWDYLPEDPITKE